MMATSKEVLITEPARTEFQQEVADRLGELNMGSAIVETPSNPTSSSASSGLLTGSNEVNANDTSGFKPVINQGLVGEHDVYNLPNNSYYNNSHDVYNLPNNSYYNNSYQGYDGQVTQFGAHGYIQETASHMGVEADNRPMVHVMQSYNPYPSGPVVAATGQSFCQQPYISPTGHPQHQVSYGSEATPFYLWNSTRVGDVPNGKSSFHDGKLGSGSNTKVKSTGLNSMRTNGGNISNKSTSTQSMPFSRHNKVTPSGSNLSSGPLKGHHSQGKFNSPIGQNQVLFPHIGSSNYRQSTTEWNGNNRNKYRNEYHRSGNFEASPELPYGPRAYNHADSSVKVEDLGVMVSRDQFNLPDFVIEYENAKFFIIKSYSEDDVHKSVKYGVWSSTPHGNKKLDAAFREAEEKSSENGIKHPVFLFFSVNGSGQFVGVAEMVGKVDFNKDMDFWQVDKWNGFFPVKWHMVKDVPNQHLRHITLENNDNKAVTHTRDTQEVLLKQGLEMLRIFQNYPAKLSLLDDFNFYENREKSNRKKPATLRMEINEDGDFQEPGYSGGRKFSNDFSNLVDFIKNPSSSGRTTKGTNHFAKKPT